MKILLFLESELIFISGPVMVSPSEDIDFLVRLPEKSHGIPRWWKIKDQSIKEIEFDNIKYTYHNKNRIHEMKITNATMEDSAQYQFSLGNTKSNKIYVYIEGKYILLYSFFKMMPVLINHNNVSLKTLTYDLNYLLQNIKQLHQNVLLDVLFKDCNTIGAILHTFSC